MLETSIIVVIALLTGMFKAMRDIFHSEQVWKVSSFKNNYNYWSWLGNTSSNKYKENTTQDKFLGSSTFFVAITDGWHLTDLLTIVGLFTLGKLSINSDLLMLSIITFFVSFNIFYSYIFTKKYISVSVWVVSALVLIALGAIGLHIDGSFRFLLGAGLLIVAGFFILLIIFSLIWLGKKIFKLK